MSYIGIIPARYGSTRFLGKPLIDIAGKSMIQRVYEQAIQSDLSSVHIATDDHRIYEHVVSFGGKVCMTSTSHSSGTERCAEAAHQLLAEQQLQASDTIINIQGDEPFIQPAQINQLIACFSLPSIQIATLAKPIDNSEDIFNPNRPKVVINNLGNALYFSRQAIPYQRDVSPTDWHKQHTYYKHIGLYGYRYLTLKALVQLAPSILENNERLEQLRWLAHGYAIQVGISNYDSIGIDVPADLEKLVNFL
jgi:3-deoxy-manno-octulosonate cytidylyltransferase (CMP-KDO synthetase)